jgi:hypothetical protein
MKKADSIRLEKRLLPGICGIIFLIAVNAVRGVKKVPLSGENRFTPCTRPGMNRSAAPAEEKPVEVYEFSIGNDNDEMFVLASNDNRVGTILAVAEGSLEGTSEEFTELIHAYLQDYVNLVIFEYNSITDEEMTDVLKKTDQELPEDARAVFTSLFNEGFTYHKSVNDFTAVKEPLLTTAWGQGSKGISVAGGYAYNNYVKYSRRDQSGNISLDLVTGCVPTAIAQIVTYHGFMNYYKSLVYNYKPAAFNQNALNISFLGIWNGGEYNFSALKTYKYIKNSYSIPGSGTEADPFELSKGLWSEGTLSAGSAEHWYKFSVVAGRTYSVWWNDRYQGNGAYSGDIAVSARYMNQPMYYFGGTDTGVDSGWNVPQSFTASSSGYAYVRVIPYNRSGTYTGSYGITYTDDYQRPGNTINKTVTAEITGNVGALMYHIGLLAKAKYTSEGTFASFNDAKSAFEYMGYTVTHYNDYFPTFQGGTIDDLGFSVYADVNTLPHVKGALNNNNPVYAAGYRLDPIGGKKGHAWVIDGLGNMSYYCEYFTDEGYPLNSYGVFGVNIPIRNYTMVHCNMGWNGTANGWYIYGMFDTTRMLDFSLEGYENIPDSRNYDYSINTGIIVLQKPW